ncbi:tellurite resistance/C4-dicarboxylate transporter family protein [Streptomyces sp. NPDC048290]|uniref:tellurite resistance/C4-dicarboxylate transporter family protein n=1 Tax=Streptomyces sp. NPDC048290 TaxID=3155811 RepID=UPI00343A06DB
MSGTTSLRAWWAQRPPAAGSAVMATGIVSTGLNLAGYAVLSGILLVVAAITWLALAADFTSRLLGDRGRWLEEAGTPTALTAVAATTVLGTRLSAQDWQLPAEVLLALAALVWPVLLVLVVTHWHERMPGAVFLGCVATQGLAVLGGTLAKAEGVAWLGHAAMVLFWLGLVLYAVALTRFDFRQLWEGAGDHWVAAGALAISALAGSKLIAADSPALYLWNSDDRGVLRTVTSALLALDLALYAVLLVAEVVRPRPHYDVRRWATVFPMGMTATAMLSVGTAMDVSWLRTPAEVLLWLAVAAWLVVAAGAIESAWRAIHVPAPDSPGEDTGRTP